MEQIQDRLNAFNLPPYHEIPDVGLYLEQVARYINSYLTAFPEMNVTPSMISNYVKLKLVARVRKKTYSRDQIACLIFIAMAKTVISMDSIRMVMAMSTEETHEKAYSYFVNELETALKNSDHRHQDAQKESVAEEEIILNHIIGSITHQMYLQRYFAAKKEELESKEEDTAEKKKKAKQ